MLLQPQPASEPPAQDGDEEAAAHRPAGATMAPVPDWVVALPPVTRTGVMIDAYDRRVEGPRTWEDQAYDATIRNGAALAQSRQGPFDGGWTVRDGDGSVLLTLELADRGEGVEGVWGDPGSKPGAHRWGFVTPAAPEGAGITLRLFGTDASASMTLTVEPTADGSWRGQLRRQAGDTPVTLRRK